MEKIIWTPAGSWSDLGTIVLKRPTEPLTLERYRGCLAGRIDRMVQRAGLERAAELLSGTVERNELLSVSGRPETTGDLLAWDSEWLAERSGMFGEDWPIPPEKIQSQLEPTVEDLEQVTLEEYLGMLYYSG